MLANTPLLFLGGWKSPWMRISASDANENTKLAASIANAVPRQLASGNDCADGGRCAPGAMTNPDSAGPPIMLSWRLPMNSALAARNCCGCTNCGRIAEPAGYANAVDKPMPSASRYTIHIWTAPASTSTARITMHAALAVRAPSNTRRGDIRSTTAPPISMKAARGNAITASTMPSAAGLPVSFSTSQGSATSVNWSPNADTELPPNSRLKLRLVKSDWRAGGGAASEAVFMDVPDGIERAV